MRSEIGGRVCIILRVVSKSGKAMPAWTKWIAIRWSAFLERLLVRRTGAGTFFGPLLIDRGRGLLYDVGVMLDEGIDGPQLTQAAAMAKLMCSDTAMAVTTDAVQILGGYGYIEEYQVERMMRDAKITQIYEGTNQIQRVVMARQLLK